MLSNNRNDANWRGGITVDGSLRRHREFRMTDLLIGPQFDASNTQYYLDESS